MSEENSAGAIGSGILLAAMESLDHDGAGDSAPSVAAETGPGLESGPDKAPGQNITLHMEGFIRAPPLDGELRGHPVQIAGRDWANLWFEAVKAHPEIATSRDAMAAWFANAVMAGHDEAERRAAEAVNSAIAGYANAADAEYASVPSVAEALDDFYAAREKQCNNCGYMVNFGE